MMKGSRVTACLSVLLMIGMISVGGCTKEPAPVNTEEEMIVDQSGRQVVIPDEINHIVTGRILPFPSAYYLATGSCKELVGIHPASKSAAEHSMLAVLAPEIRKAQTSFIQGDIINVEEIIKMNPDLMYEVGDQNQENLSKLEMAGIPTVTVNAITAYKGDSLKTMNSWLELLGQIHGENDRIQEIIEYGNETEAMIKKRLTDISEEDKPRALMIFHHSAEQIEVSGSGFFGHYWLTTTGARDVAEDIKVKGIVNMEQIYQWNPEIIYITNFCPTQPEDLLNNRVTGQDWSQIKAVQDGKVYKIPLGIYRWFPPSGDGPLMLKWLAQKHHPEIFSDYQIEDEIRAYYKRFYNYQLSDQEIHSILNPPREASDGYK